MNERGTESMKFDFKIVGIILRKDLLCLYPVALLAVLIFAGDVFITRLELLPIWSAFRMPLALLGATLFVISLFQLDAAGSLADDWLCRPVPRGELIAAKLMLVVAVIYGSRVAATLVADLLLGYSVTESLLEAVLLQDQWFQFLLAVLLMAAVVTNTLVQGIGVLIGLFVVVFMLPTPFVVPPGPLDPGIGEALDLSGLAWMATVPAKLVSLLFVAWCIRLAYWRRNLKQARLVLAAGTAATVSCFLLPMYLLPWPAVYTVQAATLTSIGAAGDEILERVYLHNPRACFPAVRVGELGRDSAFASARQFVGLNLWSEQSLRAAGPDAIAFLTGIEARGLPLDWRVKLNYVQADYHTAAGDTVSLRPASYITDAGQSALLAHAWVLPQQELRALTAAAEPELALNYSLTLLAPDAHDIPMDGERHYLPGIGFCSAAVDALNDRVDVDCFSRFHPGQLSAEFTGIEGSRVYTTADFAPRWAQSPRSWRFEIFIDAPGLAPRPSVTVTAWRPAGYIDESWSAAGLLGGDSASCPLPVAGGSTPQLSRWSDTAAHEQTFVSVDDGVQLEVLDFGGEGTPMLLLPGLGATAHSFDTLAPRLAERYRVFAMTRRGAGASSRAEAGYDTARLARDAIAVMDALDLPRAVLVGHSIAGDELTWLGARHAERVLGLVYLDAAYDRSGASNDRLRELNAALPPPPPMQPRDLLNYDNFKALQVARGGMAIPEGELIAFRNVSNPYLAGVPDMDARVAEAIAGAIGPPAYEEVTVPALALYATGDGAAQLKPWHDPNDERLLADLAELGRIAAEQQRASIELFAAQVARGEVVEIPGDHWIFLSHEAEVLREIDEFIAKVMGAPAAASE